jgi:hypothetical protein
MATEDPKVLAQKVNELEKLVSLKDTALRLSTIQTEVDRRLGLLSQPYQPSTPLR